MDTTLRQMDLWYGSFPGSYLLEAEHAELNKCLANYYGRHLLQVGGPSEILLFDNSPIRHRLRISPEYAPVFKGPSVQGEFYQLPFLPDSIELVLLPHVLEFDPCPQLILEQLYITLAPEGRLIILGFNPFSLWGVNKFLVRGRVLPWRGKFRSLFHLRHLLVRQGFFIEEVNTLFFRPPLTNKRWMKKLFVLEPLGRLLWSGGGAVYLLVAQKRLPGVSPIQEPVLKRTALSNFLEPTARVR
jgi:SAM-dependent methyltransferase